MAFNVSGLTDYVNQTSTELLVAMKIKSETAALATKQTGIKSAEALQLLATDPIPQAGGSCSFSASGSATFTQRTLTVTSIKFEDALCLDTLEAKWTQILLPDGSNYNESDIPKAIVDDLVLNINRRLETADWQGDTSSSNAYLSKYDGLIKIINAASPVTATSSTWSVANSRTIIQNILSNIPAALQGDPEVTICMGYDAYTDYVNKLAIDNLYHISGQQDPANYGTIQAENSLVKIKALHGLDGLKGTSGAHCIFALKWSNVFLGMDKLKEENQDLMWLADDKANVRYRFKFKRGWQIAYPSEIVMYSNS